MLVSLCTVCKNRANHYKQTILKNIHDNIHTANVEFVLLDYNSEDDLELWVKDNLEDYIESGVFPYYKTFDPFYFHRSHARNMMFRLAKGELICNVDADNYTGYSFSLYLSDQFSLDANIFVYAGGQNDGIPRSDIGGRICVHYGAFKKIGGYDEEMSNYGFEDYDLINRLEMANIKKKLIRDDNFLNVIEHDIKNRIAEEFPYKNIKEVLINYTSPSYSTILLIFIDGTFAIGSIINEQTLALINRPTRFRNIDNPYISLVNESWNKGKIVETATGEFRLISANESSIYSLYCLVDVFFLISGDGGNKFPFYKIKEDKLVEQALLFYSETLNRSKMQRNFVQKIVSPNYSPIGCGIVYKNFDYVNPIILK